MDGIAMLMLKLLGKNIFMSAIFVWSGAWLMFTGSSSWIVGAFIGFWWFAIATNLLVFLYKDKIRVNVASDMGAKQIKGEFSFYYSKNIAPIFTILNAAAMFVSGATITAAAFFVSAFIYHQFFVIETVDLAAQSVDMYNDEHEGDE